MGCFEGSLEKCLKCLFTKERLRFINNFLKMTKTLLHIFYFCIKSMGNYFIKLKINHFPIFI